MEHAACCTEGAVIIDDRIHDSLGREPEGGNWRRLCENTCGQGPPLHSRNSFTNSQISSISTNIVVLKIIHISWENPSKVEPSIQKYLLTPPSEVVITR